MVENKGSDPENLKFTVVPENKETNIRIQYKIEQRNFDQSLSSANESLEPSDFPSFMNDQNELVLNQAEKVVAWNQMISREVDPSQGQNLELRVQNLGDKVIGVTLGESEKTQIPAGQEATLATKLDPTNPNIQVSMGNDEGSEPMVVSYELVQLP